jgi:hypothetical protein
MRLGEILVAQGYVTLEQVDAALERQRRDGGRLGAILVAQGALTIELLLTTVKNQTEVDATIDLCKRTLASWQTICGANDSQTNRARYNLARAFLAAGRGAEAAELAETALAGHRATLGADHDWTLDSAQLAKATRRAAVTAGVPAGEPAA